MPGQQDRPGLGHLPDPPGVRLRRRYHGHLVGPAQAVEGREIGRQHRHAGDQLQRDRDGGGVAPEGILEREIDRVKRAQQPDVGRAVDPAGEDLPHQPGVFRLAVQRRGAPTEAGGEAGRYGGEL
jgi:hypothetical protein